MAKDIPKPLAFGIVGVVAILASAFGYYLINRNEVPPAPPVIQGAMPAEMKDKMKGMPGMPPGMMGRPGMPGGMPPGMMGRPGMPGMGGAPAVSGSIGGGGARMPLGRPAHKPDTPGGVPPPPEGAPEGVVGHRVDPSTVQIPGKH